LRPLRRNRASLGGAGTEVADRETSVGAAFDNPPERPNPSQRGPPTEKFGWCSASRSAPSGPPHGRIDAHVGVCAPAAGPGHRSSPVGLLLPARKFAGVRAAPIRGEEAQGDDPPLSAGMGSIRHGHPPAKNRHFRTPIPAPCPAREASKRTRIQVTLWSGNGAGDRPRSGTDLGPVRKLGEPASCRSPRYPRSAMAEVLLRRSGPRQSDPNVRLAETVPWPGALEGRGRDGGSVVGPRVPPRSRGTYP